MIRIGIGGTRTPGGAAQERNHKGVSLLQYLTDYVVIDLETTGLSPTYDDIIEVGAIRVRNGSEDARFQSLVNPGYAIDAFITELTGITNDMLQDAPGIGDVLPELRTFIGSDVILGHNVNFDVNFLYDKSEAMGLAPFSNDFVDTMRISRRLYPDEAHHRLPDVAAHLKLRIREAHRAMADAELTKVCYDAMCADMDARGITMRDIMPAKGISHCLSETVTAKTDNIDTNTAVYGKTFVFTGELDAMPRRDAMQLVVDLGGLCDDTVNKNTNFLVLGSKGYCIALREGKSGKHRKAEKMQLKGMDVQIISEDVFYEMIREAGQDWTQPEEPSVEAVEPMRAEMPTIPKNLDSMNPIDIWSLGDTFRQLGDFEKALMLFDKAKEKGYRYPAIYESYAMLYRKQKDYEDEIRILDEAVESLIAQQLPIDRFIERKQRALELLEKETAGREAAAEKARRKEEKKRAREEKKQAVQDQPKKAQGRAILQMSEDMSIIRCYDSIADAVRESGVNSKSIRDAANGVQKKAGGYVWRYEDSL